MIEFVNAKINLGLNVVRKREDGYHDIETVFYAVGIHNGTPVNPDPFCDILEISECDTDRFITSGNHVDCPDDRNLVVRARDLFNQKMLETGLSPIATHINLEKHLPDAAGLGGGSADATFTLRMLNRINGSPFSSDEITSMAGKLGADCPFFVRNIPVYAEGTGDLFTPVGNILEGFWAAIIKPQAGISTKEAFAGISPRTPDHNIREIISRPIEEWKDLLGNDFENSMFQLHPETARLKEHLYSSGALYAQMSGSGSAFFGIFPTEDSARLAATTAGTPYHTVALL